MKRSLHQVWIAIGGIVMIILGLGPANAAEKTYKMRFSLYWPPAHHLVKTANALAESVKERTKGRLIIEVYPSGQLYSQKESLKAVSMGSIEMSSENMAMSEVIDPIFAVSTANEGIITNYEMGWRLLDHPTYRKIISDAYSAKMGVKPLVYLASGSWSLLTNSRHPLRKPSDFKGLLIRSSSKAVSDKLKALGAKPAIIPSDEQIMAMQRRTVDGSKTSMGDGVSRKIWEVQKYATVYQGYMIDQHFMINVKFLNGLPADLRNELETCAQRVQASGRKLVEEEEAIMLEQLKKNMEVHFLTNEESDEWEKLYAPMVEKWLQQTGDRGKTLRDLMGKIRNEVLAKKK